MRTRTESRPKARLPINGDTLRTAVAWVLDAKIFAHLKLHGNTKWVTLDLILLVVVWVWSDSTTLTGAFTQAHRWSMDVLKQAAVGTFQGLMKALVTWSPTLLAFVSSLGTLLFLLYCQLKFGKFDLYMETQRIGWGNIPDYGALWKWKDYQFFYAYECAVI